MPEPTREPKPLARLLVVMPTWLGDCVMAMPTLRALRQLHPDAKITALVGRSVRPIVDSTPWLDRVVTPRRAQGQSSRESLLHLARRLAAGRFDLAVVLPNSFRSALLVKMAGIPRRLGYDRDSRGFLLTDRLLPRRSPKGWIPVPTREYYLALAEYLGAVKPDATMTLHTRPRHDAQAEALLARAGYAANDARPLVLINPGANYGDAKMWLPERFAAVADACAQQFGAAVAVTGAPKERAILDRVLAAAHEPMLDLPALGLRLKLLKSIVGRASLMVTNDTGPRHIAAALGTPVVTIFGPTDPAWTVINFAQERQVMVKVDCGPCQLKKCPLDHRCMTRITPAMVMAQAAAVIERG